jgi:hypothetical protein
VSQARLAHVPVLLDKRARSSVGASAIGPGLEGISVKGRALMSPECGSYATTLSKFVADWWHQRLTAIL